MASILNEARNLSTQLLRISKISAVFCSNLQTQSCVNQHTTVSGIAQDQHTDLSTAKPASEIPGPLSLPVLGCIPSMLLDKDYDLKKLHIYWNKLISIYGPVVRLDLPGMGTMVALANPDDCENLTRATMDDPDRPPLVSMKKLRMDFIEYYNKKTGILLENGEEWKRVRSRVQTPMLKPKNVTAYLAQMDEVAMDFIDRIAEFQEEYGEMPSTFQTELYKWALESVGLVALNRRLGCLEPNLPSDSDAMTLIRETNNIFENVYKAEFGPQLWRFFPTPVFKKLRKSHAEYLRVADQNIRKTEAQLLAKDPNSEEELTLMETLLLTPGLSRTDVVTLILDMLAAGIDTTSNTLGFTLYLLAKHPRVQTKVQEEVDSVLGDHKGPLTYKHLAKLSYLKWVVRESLRIFPLGMGTARVLPKDVVLGGYLIPKGYVAMTFNMHMAHNEKLFPKAKEFIPERWSRDRPLGPIHPYAAMPFGFGTRMCVGRRIAEQELYTFLTRVMQRFDIDYKYKDMDIITRLFAVPSEPLRFNFTERKR